MKITIDTKEDSHEEIKKVISLLTHLIGHTPATNSKNIFDDSKPTESGENILGIFDNPQTTEKKETPKEKTSVEFY